MSEALDAAAARIIALAKNEPASLWSLNRAVAPVLRALKWKPVYSTAAIEALINGASSEAGQGTPSPVDAAIRELESNVHAVERAAAVEGRPPAAHAAWLWRSHQVISAIVRDQGRAGDRRGAAPELGVSVLPPLTASEPGTRAELHLDSLDPLIGAALSEEELIGRRRRLLEAARELLLDTADALALDPEGVRRRQTYIANEIARLDRLQAAGLAPDVALVHQARQALERGQAQRLHAALAAMESMGQGRGGGRLSRLSHRALDVLWGEQDRFDEKASAASLARSGAEVLSPEVAAAVSRGYQRGRDALSAKLSTELGGKRKRKAKGKTKRKGKNKGKAKAKNHALDIERQRAEEALSYLSPQIDEETLFATLRVDGRFDVGGVASPVRVVEERRRVRMVPFPTQDLVLVPARTVDDVRSAIIEDPRRILHDLAAGRLLSRRYVVEEVQHLERQKLRTEVRVYVLDGSGSMLGPRAKMRDGILVAELSTLIARLQDAERQLNPVLYFRYFDDQVGPTTRVDSGQAALAAIEEALSVVRTGGTNIEAALLASFAQIRAAQDTDPDLASAQIVLVTDGEAPVDAQRILAARASVAELPIGVSIIALGEENPALRRLAVEQRQRGERVFYQFVGDTELTQTVSGRDAGLPIHLPRDVGLADLRGELEGILDEMAAAARVAPAIRDEDAELRLTAFDEVELPLDHAARDAERAKLEAARRDAQAVERRFSRWFPVIETDGDVALEPGSGNEPDLDIVLSLLLSSAEVVELVSGSGLARQVDAIEIFERLLLDAGITPWRYAELLRREKTRMAPALTAVRTAAGV